MVMILWNVWYANRYADVLEANRQAIEIAKPEETAVADKKVEEPVTAPEPITSSPNMVLKPIDPTVDPNQTLANEMEAIGEVEGEEKITVNTGSSVVTLTNVGGVIESWKLSGYPTEKGEPIELVSSKAKLKPLSLEFASADATTKINNSLYKILKSGDITLSASRPTASITFSHQLKTGFRIDKKLTFHHLSYHVDVEISLSHNNASVAGSTFAIGWYGLGDNIPSSYAYHGPVSFVDGKRKADKPDEDEKAVIEGNIEWGGLSNKYYTVAFFPQETKTAVTNRVVGEKLYSTSIRIISKGNGIPVKLGLYAGPKALSELKKESKTFKEVINYGWFDFISKPIYAMLIWFYGKTGNFGFAIIIVTVIIKVLFFPLTQKSFKSMAKMRTIQPQMKILQDRYKNNKAKMNEELIALYRKNNVNPMAGCLPMLLQIPVFISLYRVLLGSIELKGADFILWIHDLSIKDPYYITPVIMGLSMFLQQKLSPQAGDPMQRKLMMFMPVIFTVMFINFPSGLVVYWLVNNLLSIAQQYYINKEKEV